MLVAVWNGSALTCGCCCVLSFGVGRLSLLHCVAVVCRCVLPLSRAVVCWCWLLTIVACCCCAVYCLCELMFGVIAAVLLLLIVAARLFVLLLTGLGGMDCCCALLFVGCVLL